MAKKQTFGDKALKAKQSVKKMAKVIQATKTSKGSIGYRETMVPADDVKAFLAKK